MLLAKHMHEEPPPLRRFVPTVPSAVAELIHSQLLKDKERRPRMKDVARELKRLLPTVPLPERRDSLPNGGSAPDVSARLGLASTLGNVVAAAPTARFNRPLRLLGSATILLLLLISGSQLLLHRATDRVPITPPLSGGAGIAAKPTSPSRVVWEIKSEPLGATVKRATDGALLGRTPWHSDRPSGNDTEQFVIVAPGFSPRTVTFSQARDQSTELILTPESPALGKKRSSHKRRRSPVNVEIEE
jgi:hypothetical protein